MRRSFAPVIVACATLLTFALSVPASAQFIASASPRMATMRFPAAGSGTPGFAAASVPIEYQMYACRGAGAPAIMIRWGLQSDLASVGSTYWYGGESFPVAVDAQIRSVRMRGEIRAPGHGTIGTVIRVADPAPVDADCVSGGVQYHDVADVGNYVDPADADAVAQFLSTLTLELAPADAPLRDERLEVDLAAQHAARFEERVTGGTTAKGAAGAAPASSAGAGNSVAAQTPASGESSAQTDAQADAAAQAAYDAEMARLEEERRQAEERQKATEESVMGVANMAQAAGAYFGVYYWQMAGFVTDQLVDLSGLGAGMNWRNFYFEGGVFTATHTEDFIDEQSESGLTVDPAADGYWGGAGVALHMVDQDGLVLGFSGGWMMIIPSSSAEIIQGPVVGAVMEFGNIIKIRADVGMMSTDATFGIGAYINMSPE